MNELVNRWSKFKQELPSILYLSVTQIWWNFQFPAIIRLGTPSSTIISITLSVLTTCFYIILFLDRDKYAAQMDCDFLINNSISYRSFSKWIMLTAACFTMLFVWYIDFYHMSNMFYALFYTHCFIAFVLFYRAVYREDLS